MRVDPGRMILYIGILFIYGEDSFFVSVTRFYLPYIKILYRFPFVTYVTLPTLTTNEIMRHSVEDHLQVQAIAAVTGGSEGQLQ